MESILSFEALVTAAVVLMAIWGFIEVIMKIIKAITDRHDREQAWDNAVKEIGNERKIITDRYDERLDDLEAKMQSIVAEQYVIIETQQAILDGLGQLKCNGPVTDQKKKLDKYLLDKAHPVT